MYSGMLLSEAILMYIQSLCCSIDLRSLLANIFLNDKLSVNNELMNNEHACTCNPYQQGLVNN